MRRSRVIAAGVALAALAGISTWIFAAEHRGPLPPGRYVAALRANWPLSAARADALRQDALRRAAVRLSSTSALSRADAGGDAVGGGGADGTIPCRFLADATPSGTSAKFDCVLEGGEVVKVKYSRNPEIHAEAAATRLLAWLHFPADRIAIVRRVRCYGCPRYPFFTMRLLSLMSSTRLLAPHGHDDGYTDFEWVAVEHRFAAAAIETPARKGWGWFDLEHSEAPRADVDALKLLAVFLAHWDNKSDNQRLVCLDALPPVPDQPCARPVAMIQDLGSTFGPSKVNLARWRDDPIWADRRRCIVSMRHLPFRGGTFPDAHISEEGRQQLARQLASIDDGRLRALFAAARFPEFQSTTDDVRDLDAWVAAFHHRVEQIVTAGPCEELTVNG